MKKLKLTQKLSLNKTIISAINNQEMMNAIGGLNFSRTTCSKGNTTCTLDTNSKYVKCSPTNYTFSSKKITCKA